MHRILVVDDQPSIAGLFSNYLTKQGYEVSTASDGVEGLKIYTENKFDLLVTDLVMPRMNGYELCKAVKRYDPFARIVVVTGFGNTVDKMAEELRGYGIPILQKPVTRHVFVETIDSILAKT